MTRRGVSVLLSFALFLLLALFTGYSEIYYLVFLYGLLFLFALASALLGRYGIRIGHTLSFHSVMQGDTAMLRVLWNGRLVLPAAASVEFLYPAGRTQTVVDYLFFRSGTYTDTPLPCPHRGRWPVGVVSARCGDIFGFFSLTVSSKNRPHAPLYITVYPLLVDIPGQAVSPPESNDDENPFQNADQGDTFSDTRPYRDGDTMKRIHWKLSIRTRELFTRQYEAPAAQTTMIVLDTLVLPGESSDTIMGYADMAASATASLALFYLAGGFTVHVSLTGEAGVLDTKTLLIRSAEEFEEGYAALAVAPFVADSRPKTPAVMEAACPFPDSLDDVRKLFVITRQPDSDLIAQLSSLCSPRLSVSLVFLEPAYSPAREAVTPDGLHMIPVTCPRDIIERMGDDAL